MTEEEKSELLSKSKQQIFNNRVGWARTYLKKAELLIYTQRSYFKINDRGLTVLQEKPSKINIKYLKRFPEFLEFNKPSKKIDKFKDKEIESILEIKTPEELLEIGYEKYQKKLLSDLLEKVKQCSSIFFERLVVQLLVSMGYGGSFEDA